jgi:hypothetical protein
MTSPTFPWRNQTLPGDQQPQVTMQTGTVITFPPRRHLLNLLEETNDPQPTENVIEVIWMMCKKHLKQNELEPHKDLTAHLQILISPDRPNPYGCTTRIDLFHDILNQLPQYIPLCLYT